MYDALRYISKYYTVTNGAAAFDTLQASSPHITVYYICIHKLITYYFSCLIIRVLWHPINQISAVPRYFTVCRTVRGRFAKWKICATGEAWKER